MRTGELLGHERILSQIAAGGMGTGYLAEVISDAPALELAESPRIASDEAGNHLVVWRQPTTDGMPFRSRSSSVSTRRHERRRYGHGRVVGVGREQRRYDEHLGEPVRVNAAWYAKSAALATFEHEGDL